MSTDPQGILSQCILETVSALTKLVSWSLKTVQTQEEDTIVNRNNANSTHAAKWRKLTSEETSTEFNSPETAGADQET